MNPWEELGIGPTQDAAAIRRAYAARVKKVNPEDQSDAFQRLRAAYEFALQIASRSASRAAPAAPSEEGGAPAAPGGGLFAPVPYYTPAKVTYRVSTDGSRSDGPLTAGDAAESAINQMLGAPAEQRPPVLAAAAKRPEFEQLDYTEQFQNAAAFLLMSRFEALFDLVPVFAAEFDWAKRRKIVGENLIGDLLDRHEARRWRVRLEQNTEARYAGKHDALEWLRAPVDDATFVRLAADGSALRQVHDLLDEVQRDCPAALRFELDGDAVRRWAHMLAVKSRPNPAPAMSKPAQSRTSHGIWWILPAFVLMATRLCSEATNTPRERPPSSMMWNAPAGSTTPGSPSSQLGAPRPWYSWQRYETGDMVLHQGVVWQARRPQPGDMPGISPQWTRMYRLGAQFPPPDSAPYPSARVSPA